MFSLVCLAIGVEGKSGYVCVVSVWCVYRSVDGRSERYPRRHMSALYIALVSCAAVGNALVVVLRALVAVPCAR